MKAIIFIPALPIAYGIPGVLSGVGKIAEAGGSVADSVGRSADAATGASPARNLELAEDMAMVDASSLNEEDVPRLHFSILMSQAEMERRKEIALNDEWVKWYDKASKSSVVMEWNPRVRNQNRVAFLLAKQSWGPRFRRIVLFEPGSEGFPSRFY